MEKTCQLHPVDSIPSFLVFLVTYREMQHFFGCHSFLLGKNGGQKHISEYILSFHMLSFSSNHQNCGSSKMVVSIGVYIVQIVGVLSK